MPVAVILVDADEREATGAARTGQITLALTSINMHHKPENVREEICIIRMILKLYDYDCVMLLE